MKDEILPLEKVEGDWLFTGKIFKNLALNLKKTFYKSTVS